MPKGEKTLEEKWNGNYRILELGSGPGYAQDSLAEEPTDDDLEGRTTY